MEHDHKYQQAPPQWTDHRYPHSHHGTPAQEYTGFNWASPPLPAHSNAFVQNTPQRPHHQMLQPLVMPQMPLWPSQLSSQPQYVRTIVPQPTVPSMSPMPTTTPISASSSRSSTTPRRTLTDDDRRRMCEHHEQHPGMKQTEIGLMFGVERSTVSKVLRQKDRYMNRTVEPPPPVTRSKSRQPDIERALLNWAQKYQRKGVPVSDEALREKARFFAANLNHSDHPSTSSTWIEKFKRKHNIGTPKQRKGSITTEESEPASAAGSTVQSPTTSPISPVGSDSISPPALRDVRSNESLRVGSPDSLYGSTGMCRPHHSLSTASLASAFAEAAPAPFSPNPSFSPNPLSPSASYFSPDQGTASAPFPPHPPQATALSSSNNNQHRPRSQTFPLLEEYLSPSTTSEASTLKYLTTALLDSPMEELTQHPLESIDETMHNTTDPQQQQQQQQPQTISPAETMRAPPIPQRTETPSVETRFAAMLSAGGGEQPTQEEARQALQVVLKFLEQQPTGFLNLQDGVLIGRLAEKLRLQGQASAGGQQ